MPDHTTGGGGADRELAPGGRAFVYLPLEHAEDAGLQEFSVRCFEQFANAVAAEEMEFLKQRGSSF